ncbi:MAG: TetR/AcrR family transcriptional regulator [Synechococcus sp.]
MSKEQAIAQFTPVFSQHGYDGATLTRLSQASGLGKASLYHHFRGGKEDMAAAVLEQFNQVFTAMVLTPLIANPQESPHDRLLTMAANLQRFYANGNTPCLLEALSVGDANQVFRGSLQNTMRAWIAAVTQVLIEANLTAEVAQQRGTEAAIAVEGALIVSRVLGDTSAFEHTLGQLPALLLRSVNER